MNITDAALAAMGISLAADQFPALQVLKERNPLLYAALIGAGTASTVQLMHHPEEPGTVDRSLQPPGFLV